MASVKSNKIGKYVKKIINSTNDDVILLCF